MRSPSTMATGVKRSGIREIMELAARRPDAIHLEVGEPAFDTPEHIVAAAHEAARSGLTHYTPNKGLLDVRESLAVKLARRNRLDVNPEQIIITCGAVQGLMAVFTALLDPGDAVLVPDPSWPNYELMVLSRQATPVRYELPAGSAFEPDMDELERLARSTPSLKAILVNSPNNPTGTIISQPALRRLAALARELDVYLVADDVYEDLVFDGPPEPSLANLDQDGRTISVYSASKSYAMTGWRIGYVVARREIADLVAKMQEVITSCASSVSQKALQAAVDGDQGCVETMRRAYLERRDLAVEIAGKAGLMAARPSGAFYVMCNVSATAMSGTDFARRFLADFGVAVAPGETFGAGGNRMVRVSLAASKESLDEGLKRLVRAVQEWTPAR
jgi:aspartate/methionine/tyrosine aminotransferase